MTIINSNFIHKQKKIIIKQIIIIIINNLKDENLEKIVKFT